MSTASNEAANNNGETQHVRQVEVMANNAESPLPQSVPPKLAYRLYVSHFLSTWNSRLFEFGSVLFLTSIYPQTLLAMSVYALVRSAAAIVFAQALGLWIDRGERLSTVRMSILGQRMAVASSCAIFWVLIQEESRFRGGSTKIGLFAVTILLACLEKLFSVLNLVSVERDWVRCLSISNVTTQLILSRSS